MGIELAKLHKAIMTWLSEQDAHVLSHYNDIIYLGKDKTETLKIEVSKSKKSKYYRVRLEFEEILFEYNHTRCLLDFNITHRITTFDRLTISSPCVDVSVSDCGDNLDDISNDIATKWNTA